VHGDGGEPRASGGFPKVYNDFLRFLGLNQEVIF
jgi:hypothetical protein